MSISVTGVTWWNLQRIPTSSSPSIHGGGHFRLNTMIGKNVTCWAFQCQQINSVLSSVIHGNSQQLPQQLPPNMCLVALPIPVVHKCPPSSSNPPPPVSSSSSSSSPVVVMVIEDDGDDQKGQTPPPLLEEEEKKTTGFHIPYRPPKPPLPEIPDTTLRLPAQCISRKRDAKNLIQQDLFQMREGAFPTEPPATTGTIEQTTTSMVDDSRMMNLYYAAVQMEGKDPRWQKYM
jgi:hypothetical protein